MLQSYRNTSDQDSGVQARPRAQCTAVSVQDGGVFECGPKILQFFNVNFYVFTFLSFLYLFMVMSKLRLEKLDEILEEKIRKVIQPLSKQIEDAMQSVNLLNTKYDHIVKTLKDLGEAKDKQIVENASLKVEILKALL